MLAVKNVMAKKINENILQVLMSLIYFQQHAMSLIRHSQILKRLKKDCQELEWRVVISVIWSHVPAANIHRAWGKETK